ncbi:MAG: hypothetical protein JWM85_2508 [Acidimicrobiaceae bacterium]|nr:hypothetical protein [Acidimicrobiaceae bacterium]
MAPDDPGEGDTSDPGELLAAFGEELFVLLTAALPAFIERSVATRLQQAFGQLGPTGAEEAAEAGRAAAADVLPRLRQLLSTDVDLQRETPLGLVRRAIPHATAVLRHAGVPEVRRDRFSEERFPDDVYALMPANLGVLGDEVGEAAIAWGAAKAMTHRRRHAHGPGADVGPAGQGAPSTRPAESGVAPEVPAARAKGGWRRAGGRRRGGG